MDKLVSGPAQRDERLFLVVDGGPDGGLRLLVNDRPRVVGRGRDADLVLRDPATSRRHAEVRAEKGVMYIVALSGVAPLLVDGRATEQATLVRGARVLIGQTWLRVESGTEDKKVDLSESTSSDVKTLLTGAALDVRALATLFALVESLDAAEDTSVLEANVQIGRRSTT